MDTLAANLPLVIVAAVAFIGGVGILAFKSWQAPQQALAWVVACLISASVVGVVVAIVEYWSVIVAALLVVFGVVAIPFVWLADAISGLGAVVVLLIIIAVLLWGILNKLPGK